MSTCPGLPLRMSGAFAEPADSLSGIAFEVKFLLDARRALTDQYLPVQTLAEAFALEECRLIDVLYLETGDRAYHNEGWINRIRWKSWKKMPEQTYKKRYPMEGTNPDAIRAAVNRIRDDGLDVSSGNCMLEVDWGDSQMTLSATWEASVKHRNHSSLNQFNTGDAIACAARGIPDQELNWKSAGWGRKTLAHAQKLGPLKLLRARGNWIGAALTLDILFITGDSAPMAELSFKVNDYQTALDLRNRLTAHLETMGVLLKKDSLKTRAILDAHLLALPDQPDFILPASEKRIGEYALDGCTFRYVWIGNATNQIRAYAFANCRNLRYVRLPAQGIVIADHAFPDDLDLIIIGAPGSEADAYAHAHGYRFIPES